MLEGYKKLLNDLKSHERFKEAARVEYEYNQKLFHDHLSGTTTKIKSLDRVVADLRYYENMIYIEDENIKLLEDKIKAIDECLNESDITVRVTQLRAMGLKQEQVAELVERSPRQVQRIEAKAKNELDRYICHCTVHAYDGVSTITARPTVIVEASSSTEAMRKAESNLVDQYKKAKCEVNSVSYAIIKKI